MHVINGALSFLSESLMCGSICLLIIICAKNQFRNKRIVSYCQRIMEKWKDQKDWWEKKKLPLLITMHKRKHVTNVRKCESCLAITCLRDIYFRRVFLLHCISMGFSLLSFPLAIESFSSAFISIDSIVGTMRTRKRVPLQKCGFVWWPMYFDSFDFCCLLKQMSLLPF